MTDNGPQFIANQFKTFLAGNGIVHTLCPPYHPASNGQAEIGVQTFKRMFKKFSRDLPLQEKVSTILFHYRNTPHSELFLKRAPRTRLSLMKPSLKGKIERKQEYSKQHRDGPSPKHRFYDVHQHVLVRNIRGGKEKWLKGTVAKIKGPNTYIVRVPGNDRRFVHADHMKHDDSERNPLRVDDSEQKPSGLSW